MTVQPSGAMWGVAIALACAVIAGMGGLLWFSRRGQLACLPQPTVQVLGVQRGEAEWPVLPPIIWTYWHDAHLPLVVARCIDDWRRMNPGYTVQVLHPGNLDAFLDEVPTTLARLNIAKQTDWIRLALLQRHGGIWMDASIILTQPLDWVDALRQREGVDFVGFYLGGYTTQPEYPVIESWFLAAPPGNAFITRWLARFRSAAVDGETRDYLQALRARGDFARLSQRIGDPAYHTIHVVAQEVLQNTPVEHQRWRLGLLRAEDTAYGLHRQSNWKRRPLFARLLWARGDARHWPALVKLRGGERTKLEWWLRRGWYRAGSLVATFLSR